MAFLLLQLAGFAMLGKNEDFSWAERGFMDSVPELGYLDGVPVFSVKGYDAGAIVVADVARAIRVVERRRPGVDSSLHVSVDAIADERAAELADGMTPPAGQTVGDLARDLHDRHVEACVEADFTVLPAPDPVAARKIPLPAS